MSDSRKPFKKNIPQIPLEDAHNGNGTRRLLLSKTRDPVSKNLEAVTKSCLPIGGVWDWHLHENIDEYCIVLEGNGTIEFRDGTLFPFAYQDLIYIPANTEHRLVNTGKRVAKFYFTRLQG